MQQPTSHSLNSSSQPVPQSVDAEYDSEGSGVSEDFLVSEGPEFYEELCEEDYQNWLDSLRSDSVDGYYSL